MRTFLLTLANKCLAVTFLCYAFVGPVFIESIAVAETPRWAAPLLEHAISIRNGHSGKRISWDEFLTEIKPADAVFLGESHTDETTHRFQLAVFQSLLKLKEQKVVLALEMFERDVQDSLDKYLKGEIEEANFLADARPWANYHEAYRPLVEHAKSSGTPVVAANFPTPIRRRLAGEGQGVLTALIDDEDRQVPKKYLPNTAAYWKRTDNATRGHQGMMPKSSDQQRLYSTQSLWDNSMGEACADALDTYPHYSVLHLNGGFHSSYWDGTVHQLQKRQPSAKIKTVSIIPTLNPSTAEYEGKTVADYVVFVEARATNIDRGKRSVQIARDLKYRFHFPSTAAMQSPRPLLIWLCEDQLTANEAMALCKQRFGEEAAIAVVEPPYKLTGEDYSVGGRWFWPETFAEDTSTLVSGIGRIGSYLQRHFSIDADRISVVGEGAGATVASVIAVHSDRMQLAAIAINPRHYSKVKDLPLPLPEYYGESSPPKRSLLVLADAAQQEWWQKEIKQYNAVEVESKFQSGAADPWQRNQQERDAIRESLGLAAQPEAGKQDRKYILVNSVSPRAMHWARLQAESISERDNVAVVAADESPSDPNANEISAKITPATAVNSGVLPRCPGPFGGTTIVVLPPEISEEDLAKWLRVETNDPLAAASRFHRVRLATQSGERALPKVIEKLRAENRKNILIVPATFYADLPWLRALRKNTRDFEDQMTLHWLPGLGGRPGILGN